MKSVLNLLLDGRDGAYLLNKCPSASECSNSYICTCPNRLLQLQHILKEVAKEPHRHKQGSRVHYIVQGKLNALGTPEMTPFKRLESKHHQ